MMKYFLKSNSSILASLWVLIFTSMSIFSVNSQDYHSPLSLTITFDQWPEESSWDIKIGDSTVVHFADYSDLGDDSDEKTVFINYINLVPARGYYFNFYDAFIDGICCIQGSGSYLLKDANGVVIKSGGEFEVKESVSFNIAGDLCSNGIKDNREEGVDCGGECIPCIVDCRDKIAHNYVSNAQTDVELCITCSDGLKNGDELAIDCGGVLCSPCQESNCSEDYYATTDEVISHLSVSVNESIESSHKIHSHLIVEFNAGHEIFFYSGFEVDSSAVLNVKIGGCLK